MKSFARNHPIMFGVILILVAVFVCGGISVATKGFTDFNPYDRNEANLITAGEDGVLLDKLSTDALPEGLTVKMDEKGIITVDGDSSKATSASLVVLSEEITLEAGKTYTFTTGKKGLNEDTKEGEGVNVYLYGANTSYTADICGLEKNGTFTIPEGSTNLTFVLRISIQPGEYNNVQLYPTLVEGTSAAAFYD